jgi:hypothetical protein
VKNWIRNQIHIKDKNSRALEAQNRAVMLTMEAWGLKSNQIVEEQDTD